jgi:hypothetical protein
MDDISFHCNLSPVDNSIIKVGSIIILRIEALKREPYTENVSSLKLLKLKANLVRGSKFSKNINFLTFSQKIVLGGTSRLN